jgi:uncharacterized protein YybS (DUF2232 family)
MRRVLQSALGGGAKNILSAVALIMLLVALSVQLPVIGFFLSLLIPLPLLYYRQKFGRQAAAMVLVVVLALIAVIIGWATIDWLFFAELLWLGFVLGELFEWRLSIEKTVLYTLIAVVGCGSICLFIYSNLSGTDIFAFISEYVRKNLELTLSLYESMGVSQENIHMIASSLDTLQFVMVRILPSLIAVAVLVVTWTSILLARPLFKKGGLLFPDFGSLKYWKAPEPLVWVAIASGLLLLLPDRNFKIWGMNACLFLMTIYFFQGIAIVSYFFNKKQIPFLLRFFLYSLIALQQIFLLIVIGIGFFDVWLNFRKIKPASNS